MFGSLFEDEKPAGVMTTVYTSTVSSVQKRRHPCGFSGIENQGATCYLNSLLQTLLYTPEFREGLFALSDVELENKERGKVRRIPLQLQRLFARLLLVDQEAASTTELTDSFGWTNSEELQQQDVQELNRILFSAMESSLVGTSGKDLISHLYHGSIVSEIMCKICRKTSEKEEDFLDLNVIVASYKDLRDSLTATFLQTEVMKGKNQYRCSTCCKLVDAEKSSRIRCLPPILTFSLLRFSYDIAKGERFKETGRFIFPFEIDMAPFCSQDKNHEDTVYELYSVVIHSGSSSGGHYHAFIRDVDNLGKWTMNEESVEMKNGSLENGENCDPESDPVEDPVSCIKEILSKSDAQCLPMEFLFQEILKTTGMDWQGKYKKSYGTIHKFLQKHKDIFHFDSNSQTVFLKEQMPNSTSLPNCLNPGSSGLTPSTTSLENIPNNAKKSTVMNSLKLPFFDKKKSQNNVSSYGDYWFDFNDKKVFPIFGKEIEKQFAGKQSAYMLFYRKKSLLRPSEAKGNLQYKMPQKLLKIAEEENTILDRKRNYIKIEVHLGKDYMYKNGVVQPIADVSFMDVEIDKRKQLQDLCQIITEQIPDFVLFSAKEIPSGLHLSDKIDNYSETLESLKILDGAKLFALDPAQMKTEEFLSSFGCQPILLNISIVRSNGDTLDFSQGFSDTSTLGELQDYISTTYSIPIVDVELSKLKSHGDENNKVPFMESDYVETLADIGLIDGDYLIAESLLYKKNQKELANRITVSVENCCANEELLDSNPLLKHSRFTVDPTNTISDVKTLAMKYFNLDDSESYVLKKLSKGHLRKPGLHDHHTLQEAGLGDMAPLMIKPGKPPDPDEITIMFGLGIGETPDYELTCKQFDTVADCFAKMLKVAGVSGDTWHLRRTNWCGEPMNQIFIDESTLEEANILHDETLVIMEGRSVKGFLTFAIHLYPRLDSMNICPSVNGNGLHSDIEKLEIRPTEIFSSGVMQSGCVKRKQDLLSSGEDSTEKFVGNVDISNEASVSDLKSVVLTLESLTGLNICDVRLLRLQTLENGRPARVLRGPTNSLRKLKLVSQPLAATILVAAEDLSQTDILLNVRERRQESKSYSNPVEFIWDSGSNSSPRALKQAIADITRCPIQRLVTVKHFPEKCQWVVLDDTTLPKKNMRKKNWSAKKVNVRNAPYYLKDGDTIGIKDVLMDLEETDDFMTPEDIEGQEALKAAAEFKRIKRQEEKSPSRTKSCEWILGGGDKSSANDAKKSEVGIRIHVDDFT